MSDPIPPSRTPLVIGFTGTQAGMTDVQKRALLHIWHLLRPLSELHHGDCIGADAEAHVMFDREGKSIVIHPPVDRSKQAFCKAQLAAFDVLAPLPYLERNRAIVDASDVLFACPRDVIGENLRSGTWSTVRYARRLERPVFIVRPDGRIEGERVGALGLSAAEAFR